MYISVHPAREKGAVQLLSARNIGNVSFVCECVCVFDCVSYIALCVSVRA